MQGGLVKISIDFEEATLEMQTKSRAPRVQWRPMRQGHFNQRKLNNVSVGCPLTDPVGQAIVGELMTATTSAMLICNMVVSSLFVVHVSTVSMLLPRLTPMCRPSSGAVQHALMPLHQKICPVVPLRPILSFRAHNLHASRA